MLGDRLRTFLHVAADELPHLLDRFVALGAVTEGEGVLDDLAVENLATDIAEELHVGAATDMEEDLVPGNDQQAAVALFAEDVDFTGFAVEADWVVNVTKELTLKPHIIE